MFEIGGSLAAARKGQSLAPEDAERLTCLRWRYLSALEDDDFDALPGHTYARAFLRTYADALGLDADRFVREFDVRHPAREEEPVAWVMTPHRRRPGRRRALVAALAVAAVAAVVAWAALSSPPKQAAFTPPPAAATRLAEPRVALSLHHTAAPHAVPPPLVVSATRGPCWLLVRRGAAGGPVLYEGTLAQGATLSFKPRVWVRLGAPWNVSVRRGGHVVTGLSASSAQNIVA